MSAFVLKIIALISMSCDHLSYLIYGSSFSNLNYIGRIAFPIFCFQISEGYIHTNNLKNYFLRLFVFALISEIPYLLFLSLFTSVFELNVFFTLFLGLCAIVIFDNLKNMECSNKYVHYLYILSGLIFVLLLAIIAEFTKCDYGYYGILIIFIFYIFKKNKILMNLSIISCTSLFYIRRYFSALKYLPNLYRISFVILFTCSSLIFINLYNNKKGKNIKYFVYFFYPIHLIIIYLLHFSFS